jgi:hypothetical protein
MVRSLPGWRVSKTLTNTNPGTNKKRSRIKTSGLVAIALIKLATINYLRRASIVVGLERATPNLLPVPFMA